MKILVTGASGVLGREVLIAAQSTGIAVRATSRRPAAGHTGREEWMPADLATGQGIDEAVRGCDAIVHAASDPRHADAVDVNGTRRLTEAAGRASVRHLVFVSIVGVDRESRVRTTRRKARRGAPRRRRPACPSRSSAPRSSTRCSTSSSRPAARVPLVLPLPAAIRRPARRGVRGGRAADAVHRRRTARPGHRLRRARSPPGPRGRGDSGSRRAACASASCRFPSRARPPAAIRAGKGTAPQGDRGAITWGEWLKGTRDT